MIKTGMFLPGHRPQQAAPWRPASFVVAAALAGAALGTALAVLLLRAAT